MLTLQDMTPAQRSRIKKFVRKYNNENTISFYSGMFSNQRVYAGFRPYYESYTNIVKRTAAFYKELGCTSPLVASVLFEYTLWNGYFSKDKHLVYSSAGRINNFAATGADIMLGKSVCLNNAEMLTRVLKEMGDEAYFLGCSIIPNKNTQREYRPNIPRDRIEEKPSFIKNVLMRPLFKKIGNHAVTLVKCGGNYIISDPTSIAFAEINDVMKAKFVGINQEMGLNPGIGMALNEGDKHEYIDALLKAFILSDHKPMTTAEMKEIYETVVNACDRNKNIFEDFHAANKQDIDVVCKTLTKSNY